MEALRRLDCVKRNSIPGSNSENMVDKDSTWLSMFIVAEN